MKRKLLSREEFKKLVFKRDNYKCVVCHAAGVDAHHLIERKLWLDGGYYLNNGITLCGKCHILAESTEISIDKLRKCAKIKEKLVPPGFPVDIDKWGFKLSEEDKYGT